MEKFYSLIVAFLITFTSFSQDCNIGNSDGSDPDFTIGNIIPDFLLGVSFTLSEVGVLHSLNMIGNGSGANFQMAIYDDNAGVPNNLVAATAISTVGAGVVSLPVSPVQLEVGDYWIMAVYNDGSGTNHSNVNHVSATNNVVYYTPLPFGDPIPANGSAFESYTGQDLLYFAEISCGALSVNSFKMNTFSITPNPASNFITIGTIQENKTFEVFDLTGKKLIQKELSATNNQIDISHLTVGTYFLKYDSNSIKKFVKKSLLSDKNLKQ